jgi:hypothetical protein
VEALAAESGSHSAVAHWISDITTSAFSKVLGARAAIMQHIRHVPATDALKGEQILGKLGDSPQFTQVAHSTHSG